MANSGQVTVCDDYFYCSICLEIFDTPRTLPCLHSFCQECLKGYILKIKEKTGTQQLFCPVCRADTKTDTVKFKQVKKWMEYFPINFTLLSILKERKLTMNPKGNDCEACLREDIKVDACVYCYDCSEKLCEECKRHHKKNRSSTNHKLINTSDESEKKFDLEFYEYLLSLSKCQKHSAKAVEYLCKDHDQLCCNECAIVTHRKCQDIVSLADEIKVKTEENADSTIQDTLNTLDNHVDKLITHETTYLANIDSKENEVKDCLRDFKVKLDAAYNKLEERIMLKISERKATFSKASSLQTESAKKLKDDVSEAGKKIKNARKMGASLHIFLLEREMSKQIKQYENTFTSLRDEASKAAFNLSEISPQADTVKRIEDMYQIEENVDEEHHLPVVRQTKDFRNRKLTLEREVSLNESREPRYCTWINNYIVISYLNSTNLVAYKADDGTLLSTYQCPSSTSVIATENDEFAVAVPKSNKIHILKIEQNQIVSLRELSCSKLDIMAYNSKDKHLLTFSRSETLIRKITLDGRNIGYIDLGGMQKSYLQYTFNLFVDTQYERIFLSAHDSHMLLCIEMSGNELFQHEIKYPWSVITDSQGNVYVASYTNDCIQHFSPKGQMLNGDILGDNQVKSPMALSFNKEISKLVITCAGGSGKIKIYNFQ